MNAKRTHEMSPEDDPATGAWVLARELRRAVKANDDMALRARGIDPALAKVADQMATLTRQALATAEKVFLDATLPAEVRRAGG